MGMLTRAGALIGLVLALVVGLVLASAVAVVSTPAPASAAVVPCTQTYTRVIEERVIGTGRFTINPYGGAVPGAVVTDVDVRVDFEVPTRSPVTMGLSGFAAEPALLFDGAPQEDVAIDLTFDDEADGSWTSNITAGTVQPRQGLARFDGRPLDDPWTLMVDIPTASGLRLNLFEVTVTASDCDSDGDGVPDRFDNCPWVANPAQVDWDGDGVGNVCDGTPGTNPDEPPPSTPAPPSTPTPPSPTTSPPPVVTSVPGCTVGCAYARTVGLRHLAKRHRLRGVVESAASGCRSAVPVTLWRQRRGADRKLVVVTTRDSGAFGTRAPRRAGRYYVTVGSAAEAGCATDRSRAVRVRRR